jgi:uncharacterized membrane protein YebE (DUF533 family)
MIDPQKLIEQFLGGGAGASTSQHGEPAQRQAGGGSPLDAVPDSLKGFGGGVAAGGLAGLLLGTKGGRKMAKKAMKVGGLAVLGGLAYKAYNDWQATKGGNSTVSQTKPRTRPRTSRTSRPRLKARRSCQRHRLSAMHWV